MASCCLVCNVTRLVLSSLTSARTSLSEPPCRVVMYELEKSSRVCRKVTFAPSACAFDCAVKIEFCRVLNALSKAEVLLLTVDQVWVLTIAVARTDDFTCVDTSTLASSLLPLIFRIELESWLNCSFRTDLDELTRLRPW